jgi:hypothetical protein
MWPWPEKSPSLAWGRLRWLARRTREGKSLDVMVGRIFVVPGLGLICCLRFIDES